MLTGEAEDIAHALSDDELDYLPLLPDDEHVLADRVQALADWCAGVVLGFGLASGHIRQDEMELIEHYKMWLRLNSNNRIMMKKVRKVIRNFMSSCV